MAPALEREMRSLPHRARRRPTPSRCSPRTPRACFLQRPVRGARVIALDPGYRTGCKVAVLDEYRQAARLRHRLPHPAAQRRCGHQAHAKLAWFATPPRQHHRHRQRHGQPRDRGGGGRPHRRSRTPDLRYTIVNEAGASVYSASKLASEEYPDLDVTTRGAIEPGPPPAGPARRAGEDTAAVHRRGPVPARPRPGGARPRARRRGGATS